MIFISIALLFGLVEGFPDLLRSPVLRDNRKLQANPNHRNFIRLFHDLQMNGTTIPPTPSALDQHTPRKEILIYLGLPLAYMNRNSFDVIRSEVCAMVSNISSPKLNITYGFFYGDFVVRITTVLSMPVQEGNDLVTSLYATFLTNEDLPAAFKLAHRISNANFNLTNTLYTFNEKYVNASNLVINDITGPVTVARVVFIVFGSVAALGLGSFAWTYGFWAKKTYSDEPLDIEMLP